MVVFPPGVFKKLQMRQDEDDNIMKFQYIIIIIIINPLHADDDDDDDDDVMHALNNYLPISPLQQFICNGTVLSCMTLGCNPAQVEKSL